MIDKMLVCEIFTNISYFIKFKYFIKIFYFKIKMIKPVSEILRLKSILEGKKLKRIQPANGEIVLSTDKGREHFAGLKQIGKGYNADVYCCIRDNSVLKIGDPVSLGIEYLIFEDLKKIGFPVIDMEMTQEYSLIKPYLDPQFFANKISDFTGIQKEKLEQIWKQANEYAIITGIPLDMKADNLWWDNNGKTWILIDAGPKLDDNDSYPFEFTLDLESGKDFIRKIKGEKVTGCHVVFQSTYNSYKKSLIVRCKKTFFVAIKLALLNYKYEKDILYQTTLYKIKEAVKNSDKIEEAFFYLKCISLTQEIIELVKSSVEISKQLCKTFAVCPKSDESQSLEKSFKKEVKSITYLRKDTEKYHNTLNFEDRKVIISYTGNSYDSMNNCLRNSTDVLKCSPETVDKIIRLDRILTDKNSPRLKEDIIVYRGIDEYRDEVSRRITLALENLQPGDLWEDRGFVSTSVQHPPAGFVGKTCCLFEIFLKKGTPAYYIGKDSSSSREEEVILLPGIVLKFIAKRTGIKGILYQGNKYINTYTFECAGCQEDTRFAISPIPKVMDAGLTKMLSYQPEDRLVGKDRLSYFHLTDMYNKYIPKKDKNVLRLMSWNIHEWRDKNSKKNELKILDVFKNLNPDVLGLQEVTHKSYGIGCEADMGSHGEKLRNDIVVRKSIDKFYEKAVSIKHERCMIVAGIIINKEKIIIGNLHLDVSSSKKRMDNISVALGTIEQIAKEHDTKNIVLMGDFNSYRIADYNEQNYRELTKLKSGLGDGMNIFESIDYLEKNGYEDTFSLRNVLPPINTNFYGGRIDFIFLSKKFSPQLIGTYAYFSNLSDHIAIIADFRVQQPLEEDPLIEGKMNEKNEEQIPVSLKGPIGGFQTPKFIVPEFLNFLLNVDFGTYNGIPLRDILYPVLEKRVLSIYIASHLLTIHLYKNLFIEDGKKFFKVSPEMNLYLDVYLTELEKKGSFNRNKFQYNKIQFIVYQMFIKNTDLSPEKIVVLNESEPLLEKIQDIVSKIKNNIQMNSQIKSKNIQSDEMLIDAATKGDLLLVKNALLGGADIHARNDEALIKASGQGHLEVVEYLVEHGADIHAENDKALKMAEAKGWGKIIKYLKSQTKGKKNDETTKEKLLSAAEKGDFLSVQNALQKGVDIRDKTDALKKASFYGHYAIVKYLVEAGANIHVDDEVPLAMSSSKGYFDIVKYLIKQGAKVNPPKHVLGALNWASKDGQLDIVKYLIKRGADIHAHNDIAIKSAVENGHLDIVKYLVEHGADIHAYNDEPIKSAEKNGHTEVVEYLESLNTSEDLDESNIIDKIKNEFPDSHLLKVALSPAEKYKLLKDLKNLKKELGTKQNIYELYNLKNLDLSYKKLTEIPASLGNLSNLQKLNLSYNKLTEIPASLGNLSNLQELDLTSNKLTQIPLSLGNLSKLQKLDLSVNKLIEIPSRLGNLSKLKELNLSVNNLTEIPASFGNLTSLIMLDLEKNKLTKIPPEL
jgi:endonuclease/exonuclease/phosphatase family metal-dependent hydrolase/ankyrin repeat protein